MTLSEMIKKYNEGIGEGWKFDVERYCISKDIGYKKEVWLDDETHLQAQIRVVEYDEEVIETTLSKWEKTDISGVYQMISKSKTSLTLIADKKKKKDLLKGYTFDFSDKEIKNLWAIYE